MIKNHIKKFRKEYNITLVQLSKRCGVGKSEIAYIENHIKDPKLTTAVRISKSLNKEFNEVFDVN